MSLNDTIANALAHVNNSEKSGKTQCIIRDVSKLTKEVLEILKQNEFIEDFALTKTNQGEFAQIALRGAINRCGAIKPRFSLQLDEFEKFEKRFLPAKDFGIIIISTSKGLMTHIQAKEKKIGGKLIAYCY